MGGGNAQKTAKSRERHLAKADAAKNSGGGKSGMEARSGTDMAAKVGVSVHFGLVLTC